MEMLSNPTFGDLLRRFRDRANLTQEELAERAGLSADAIGLLERGARQRPQRHTVDRLGEVLGLAVAERAAFAAAARSTPRQSPALPLTALPLPATTFVGRAEEIAAFATLLADGTTRLLTLTGPGGVGKTRLALEAATRLAVRFPDGLAFVPLAALPTPDLVPGALAQALGLAERPGRTLLAGIVEHLRERRTLLLFDNCEHLPDLAPLVAELLIACPHLTLLATSRTPLHLSAERQFPVSPLALPPVTALPPEDLARHAAVALFLHRARAVAPAFTVTAASAEAIGAICRRLDGLPLALELAAAWTKILPADLLLARLAPALPLLADGPRDLPARQRTLRDAIGWSYDLLTPSQQALLRRLAVFAGGCTLEAIEAVCAPGDASPGGILVGLAALVDASLVQPPAAAAADTLRYSLLETVREYAEEQLIASGEAEAIRRRHAETFLAVVEAAQAHLVGPDEAVWLLRLEAEHPNFRAALRWCLHRREADLAVRFAGSLWRFWAERTHLTEGRRWLTEILTLARSMPAPDNADPTAGIAPPRLAMLLHVTANLIRVQGDYPAAEAMYEECLAIRRARDDRRGIVGALNNLGIIANEQGNYARALRHNEAALPLARNIDDPYPIAMSLVSLGESTRALGDPARAAELFTESRAHFAQLGHTWGIALALSGLGDTARDQGDTAQAAAAYRESLALTAQLGERRIAADALEGLAHLASAANHPTRAAQLLAAADTLRQQAGTPRPPSHQSDHARTLAATRLALPPDLFATAWDEGSSLSLEEALDLALEDVVS
ncbi:MAG: tetratricopeptide repeat protein [Thermomicrobiales bacterium]